MRKIWNFGSGRLQEALEGYVSDQEEPVLTMTVTGTETDGRESIS